MQLSRVFIVAVVLCCAGVLGALHKEPLNCGDAVVLRSNSPYVRNAPYITTFVGPNQQLTVIANATSGAKNERYQLVCYNRIEGDLLKYGDTFAIKKLHEEIWLNDGETTATADLYNTLDRSERKQTFMLAHSAQNPIEGDEFTVFNPANLDDRSPIGDNATIVLRSPKLQTLTIEKPILGLQYQRRLELKVLGGDELGIVRGKASFPIESLFQMRVLCATNKGKLCSGRGKCTQGKCECPIEYDGPACEYKRRFGFCHVTGDPHIQTFDKRRYNVFSEGEYLAYSNQDSRNNEAVVITTKPVRSSITTVVHKVSFRQGSNLVSISASDLVQFNCGNNMARHIKKAGATGIFLPGTNIAVRYQPNAGRWRLSSGDSGLVIWVKSYGWGISVWIRTFSVPRGVAHGLCGNFNRDPWDDLGPKEFPLEKHFNPNRHYLADLSLPADHLFSTCAGLKLDFSSPTDDMINGDAVVVGEATYDPAELKSQLKTMGEQLIKDAEEICGNQSKIRTARKICECRGLNKVDTFHLFADCVMDECETGSLTYVQADCDAEETDSDEVQRISDYEAAILQMQSEKQDSTASLASSE